MLANKYQGTGNSADINDNDEVQSNGVLNALPADVVTTIESDIYGALTAQNDKVAKDGSVSCPDITQVDIAEELNVIFTDPNRDTDPVNEPDVYMDAHMTSRVILESNHKPEDTDDQDNNNAFFDDKKNNIFSEILRVLQTDSGVKRKKWTAISFEEICQMTNLHQTLKKNYTEMNFKFA